MVKPSILKIFAKSPIKPMQQHMELVDECVTNLLPFFQKCLNHDWQAANVDYEKISLLENKADGLKKEIRLHLPSRLLLPIDRGDFIGLLKSQDQIANTAKRVSNLIYYRKMQFPEQIAKNLLNFVQLGIDATKLAVTQETARAIAAEALKANTTDVTASLALKANINNPTFTGTVGGITKSMVGLGNADNISDVNKPIKKY